MNENDFKEQLKKHNLSIEDACEMIYIKTKVFLRPDAIKTRLNRYRNLSKAYSAAFALFFRELERSMEDGKV